MNNENISFDEWKKRNKSKRKTNGGGPDLDGLAGMSRMDYAKKRKEMAEALGIPVGFLDEEYREAQREAEHELPACPHWNVEPWPNPVDIHNLVIRIAKRLSRHVVMSRESIRTAALWIVFAWVHDAAVHSPILIVTSPAPDCGKSTLLALIGFMVPRGHVFVEISPAVLYRMIERWHPTLIVDEADHAFKENPDLRAVINAGWTLGVGVPRCHPDTHEPEFFDTFGPKAIGLKGLKIPDTTLSRGIVIDMERKLATDKAEGFKHIDDEDLAELRRRLARWAQDNVGALRDAEPEAPEGFANRLADNWHLMLAIADRAGLGKEARQSAIALSQRSDEATLSIELLVDCHKLMTERGVARIKSAELVNGLTPMEDRPWIEMPWTGKPITQPQLARLLKCFKIKPKPMRIDADDRARGYELEDFKKALDRYAPRQHPQKSRDSVTTAENSQKCRDKSEPGVTPEMAENSQCHGVTPDMGGLAEGEVTQPVSGGDSDPFATIRDPSLKLKPRSRTGD
jgi:putative DNA primase/helicase